MTWHPDMPQEYRNQIITGDARVLAERIPDESVDLIFTDPVYDQIDDYRWLAETAERVLKLDGAILAWTFNSNLPAIINAMNPPLTYRYCLNWQRYGPIYRGPDKLISVLTPCVWMDRDCGSKMDRRMADWIGVSQGGLRDNAHQWSKPSIVITHWLDGFSKLGAIVLDPFSGGGTVPVVCTQLRRNYIAFEIDPATANLARERVANTQPPLFVPEPEQMEMEI